MNAIDTSWRHLEDSKTKRDAMLFGHRLMLPRQGMARGANAVLSLTEDEYNFLLKNEVEIFRAFRKAFGGYEDGHNQYFMLKKGGYYKYQISFKSDYLLGFWGRTHAQLLPYSYSEKALTIRDKFRQIGYRKESLAWFAVIQKETHGTWETGINNICYVGFRKHEELIRKEMGVWK